MEKKKGKFPFSVYWQEAMSKSCIAYFNFLSPWTPAHFMGHTDSWFGLAGLLPVSRVLVPRTFMENWNFKWLQSKSTSQLIREKLRKMRQDEMIGLQEDKN